MRAAPDGSGRHSEFYLPNDPHNPVPGKATIQGFGKLKPADVVGEMVSHYLGRGVDPKLTGYYNTFKQSLTPAEHTDLRRMYKASGDMRPFALALRRSLLPAYFRGYPFHQLWANETHYTAQQKHTLDSMMAYLQAHKRAGIGGQAGAHG